MDALLALLGEHVGQELTTDLAERIVETAFPASRPFDLSQFPVEQFDGLEVRIESVGAVFEELRGLHRAHWNETEEARHGLPFAPDYGRWVQLELSGRYLLATVRRDGRMVGYCAVYLDKSTHTQEPVCTEQGLFLLPEARRGRNGIRLFRYMERIVIGLGVREITVMARDRNKVWKMWSRLGYRPVGLGMVKVIPCESN